MTDVETKGEYYTAGEQVNLKQSPPAGDNDTNATVRAGKLNRRDTAAILTSTIKMLQDAGWPVGIATMDGKAYLIITGAEWNCTPAGWMLVEA